MRWVYFLSINTLLTVFVFSQATLSGYVRDATSGENLIGATIIDSSSGKGTVTNTYGYYSLTLSQDSAILQVSYVGYIRQTLRIALTGNQTMNISLETDTGLKEIVVTSEDRSVFGDALEIEVSFSSKPILDKALLCLRLA